MRAFNTTLSASAVSQAKNPHGCAAARQALEAVREADVQVKQAEEQLVIMEHVALSAREQIKRHAQDEAEAHAQAERELQRVRAEMKLKAKRQQVCDSAPRQQCERHELSMRTSWTRSSIGHLRPPTRPCIMLPRVHS